MSADGEDRKFKRWTPRNFHKDGLGHLSKHSTWVGKRKRDQKWIVGTRIHARGVTKDFAHINFLEEVDRKTIKLIKTGIFMVPGRILESLPDQLEKK